MRYSLVITCQADETEQPQDMFAIRAGLLHALREFTPTVSVRPRRWSVDVMVDGEDGAAVARRTAELLDRIAGAGVPMWSGYKIVAVRLK